MRFLLDTHVWLWMDDSPRKLGKSCRNLIENPANELSVATISTLEIGQLMTAGRISVRGTLAAWVRHSLAELGVGSVELTHDIAVLAYALPGSFHKDPADRILVATAIHHGLTLVTADERILAYAQVMTLDAGK
jgi:PIN domain nuclease of toxin-antitoxin system